MEDGKAYLPTYPNQNHVNVHYYKEQKISQSWGLGHFQN